MNNKAQGTIGALFAGAKSPRGNNSIAQGTIEYLIIVAVVVVISLIVVALVIGVSSSPSQQISSSSEKLGGVVSGGISIVEAVSDLDGDSLIRLSNNSSEGITLKKISVGGNSNDYDNYISGVDSAPVSLTGLASSCPCESGQKSVKCEFVFEYDTLSGLRKIERRTINVQCTNSNETPTPRDSGRVFEPIVFGTLKHPWVINNCVELQDMNQHLDGNYILGKDINCYTDTHEGGELYNDGKGFSPIGNNSAMFVGSLNGNNYSIIGLVENRSAENYGGLFGYLYRATISNLKLVDVNISYSGFSVGVGGIAGNQDFGVISNCSFFGNVTGALYVGGLVGYLDEGVILNSYTTGNIGFGTAWTSIGAIVGEQDQGLITNSFSTANVDGSYFVGGIVGSITGGGIISNSYSTGDIIASNYGGGIVGKLTNGNVSNSYSTSNLVVEETKGAIIGDFVNGNVSNLFWYSSVLNCCGGISCDSNCTKVSSVSSFYPQSSPNNDYNVPMQNNSDPANNWTFGEDGNWVATDTYPILSWQ